MLPSNVSYWLSSSNRASRARASIRKCLSHFGQTFMFSSRSFFQIICRQPSHFTHNPSVRTFFSPEVSSSPDCRLNQVIRKAQPSALSHQVKHPGLLNASIRFLSAPLHLSHTHALPAAFP